MPYADPDMAKARRRYRDYVKLATVSDITPQQELAMRKKARKCPLCGARMTDKPNLPNSKHLDHILPLNQGGTHTHGNVRIICLDCNIKRPKDGSDYTGMLTLWAQGEVTVSRPNRNRNAETCRKGLHPWTPENIELHNGKKRCKPCREVRHRARYPQKTCKCGASFSASGYTLMCPACTDATARQAAELHAAGGLTWDQVAAEVGYGSGTGIRDATRRIGYKAEPEPKAEPKSRACPGCGTPRAAGSSRCQPCLEAKAWRAVELKRQGLTLEAIAPLLGYTSKSSVTNLMSRVIAVSDARYVKHELGA